MSPSRRLRGPAGAVALATVLVAGAPAVAGAATTTTQSSSASTITLGTGFRKDLRSARVTLKAVKPAKLKGSKLTLPVTKTTTSGTLTLTHSGALTLKKGKRSVKLSAWQTVAGKSVRVSAKVGKKRRTVFTITGGKVVKDATKRTVTVSGGTVKLTSAAAKDLRTTLKAKGITGGTVGKVGVKAEPKASLENDVVTPPPPKAPALPAPGTPTPTPTTPEQPTPPEPSTEAKSCPTPVVAAAATGSTDWSLWESWVDYLYNPAFSTGEHGIFGLDGVTQPVAGNDYCWRYDVSNVSTANDGTTTIEHTGTLRFRMQAHGIDTRITNPRIVVAADGKTAQVYADGQSSGDRSNPQPTPFTDAYLFDLDLSQAAVTYNSDGTLKTWNRVPATIATAQSADIFSYAKGESFGAFDVTLPHDPITAASLGWTQTNGYQTGASTLKTFMGYMTSTTIGSNGTVTPTDGTMGETVTAASASGADARYTHTFAASSSTVDLATLTGSVRYAGALTFSSQHGITVSLRQPRVQFNGADDVSLYASGQNTPTRASDYDESAPVFKLKLGTSTPVDNGDGTVTFAGVTPSIATADWAFPSNYPVGSGPDRAPNTFGSFSITLPKVARLHN